MLPKLKFNLTNWVDGMKITRQHFADSENALVDQIRDSAAARVRSYSYGLLSPLAGERAALECNTTANQAGKLIISVPYCRALTSGGCRIEIIPGLHPELSSDAALEIPAEGKSLLAVIAIDPYNRLPYGPADAEAYPVRNAWSLPAMRLEMIPADQLDTASIGPNHMPVARFFRKSGELVKDNSYIPPCAVVEAHPATRALYNELNEYLNQIQEYSTAIIRKIADNDQKTQLALNVKLLCDETIATLAPCFFAFRNRYREEAPICMGELVVQLAATVQTVMTLLPSRSKEELLDYFKMWWGDTNPGQVNDLILNVLNSRYTHEDIGSFFAPLMEFLKLWSGLLEQLQKLKLIGDRGKGFDFGGTTRETNLDQPKKKGFTIFD